MLEEEAEKVVEKCDDKATGPAELSMVIKKTKLTTCNPHPLFKEAIDGTDGWWSVVTTHGESGKEIVNSAELQSFATLANAEATRIGCAQKNCDGSLVMACMVYGKAPAVGKPIYKVGKACSGHSDCDTYAGSKCGKDGLCIAGYPDPNKKPEPEPEPPTEKPPTTQGSSEGSSQEPPTESTSQPGYLHPVDFRLITVCDLLHLHFALFLVKTPHLRQEMNTWMD
ncbi:hypothetical protein Y032_0010g991 [Ancylostoma ceylanicum]|uniref:SCP domain-containing protein n=1 Tax=Ancylostoma ceylanicum TaxID=53326 RepID=A0A016VHD5_9BILA|nr:hypothetical protein Y032_0010g991 [Ancylostoma ceylanicum]